MEPLEWLILGVGLVVGGLFGAKGKGVVKTAAKGYMIAGEKAQEWTANLREDFRDAVEEARYEKEREEAVRQEELHNERANEMVSAPAAKSTASNSARKSSAGSAASAHVDAKPA